MDLNQLTEQIIEKSFPELKQRKFQVSFLKEVPGKSFMAVRLQEHGDFLILADEFSKNYPEAIIKQVLAHELSHITRSVKRWKITERLSRFLYYHSIIYQKYEEIKAEQLAASRGYEPPNI